MNRVWAYPVAVAAAALPTGAALAAAAPPATMPSAAPSAAAPAEPAGEVESLRQRVRLLEEKVRRLEARVGVLPSEALTEPEAQAREGPDTAALAKLRLPEAAAPEAVSAYIDAVLAASPGQRVFSPDDPQVAMLAAVGVQHFDLLLEAAKRTQGRPDHLVEAMARLAGLPQKSAVLDALADRPELVRVVSAKGWERDARDTLARELGRRDRLPHAWVEAAASLRDPSTYAALKAYFVEGRDRAATYEAIKDLPGLRLDDAVAEAWLRAQKSGPEERVAVARLAAERGHADALDALIASLDRPEPLHAQAREAILRRLPAEARRSRGESGPEAAPPSDEALRRWWAEHRGRLRFDPASGEYRPAAETGAAATGPASRPATPPESSS